MGSASEILPSIESLKSLDEIEQLATKKLSKRAWSFNYAAAGDLISKQLNTDVYRSILLRPRVFIDVSKCDLTTTIMGHKVGLPIFISPMAMARLAHPTGEAGISEACRALGVMHMISNNASMTPEQIVAGASPDQIFGFQLYAQKERKESEALMARVNQIKEIKCIVLCIDEPVPGKHELGTGLNAYMGMNPLGPPTPDPAGVSVAVPSVSGPASDLTWEGTLEWIAAHTDLPVILKGLQTHEDARIASGFAQVKGIVLSNHGARVLDTAPPAIHTLLEIRKYCPEVFDKVEVTVDGGIRRGTDVVKALCLGAKAVGIGRAALWGLGAGGVAGVERTLQILADEIKTTMQLLGVHRIEDLGPQHVNARIVEQQIYDAR
ncbi:uncharacterized protein N7515_004763 [Penicillium bovifimosum]|uniref:L-lactate dehydrogenase (cytochrome) n=1 Tax=Penicillium bovifimosum TaxID=126998 RepID=A0A9W9H112_9EURO|nr:uncharacterized protein N7515_004763 [Penicillium bovifimosum]KAJ5135485.1 hypothetical protein N7515_004763 [Penicillium bovifimosum]